MDLGIVFSNERESGFAVPLTDYVQCSLPLNTEEDSWYPKDIPRPAVYAPSWKGDSNGQLYINFCVSYCRVVGSYFQDDPAMFSIIFEPGTSGTSPTLSWDVPPIPATLPNPILYTEKERSGVVTPNGACLINQWWLTEPAFGGYPYAMANELDIISMSRSGPAKYVKVPDRIQRYIPEYPGISNSRLRRMYVH